ncbi:MAG TPA: GGDEF domain-containing protein [Acidobacteriota bacterium]|jgi:diguanylate cyclase (GGDEF)-like protein
MILVLFSNPETTKLLAPLPADSISHPLNDVGGLSEFQRRRIRTVLCEWDDSTPPASSFSHLFPQAELVTVAGSFNRRATEDSRRKGYSGHYFLPLPENFFEETQRRKLINPSDNLFCQAAEMLQLLEKNRDYSSICHYAREKLRTQFPDMDWSVHVQEKDESWRMVFASPGWSVERENLMDSLSHVTRRTKADGLRSAGVEAENLLCLPLIKDGICAGAVCCQTEQKPVAQYRSFLRDLAEFLGSAFHHIDMLIEKERLSFTDTLTSLYNYRYLRQFLASEIRRCTRYNKNVSVLFIDIDWFKAVNDNHGHLAGSETLVEVGYQFSSLVRESDVVVRYGGDEYVIVLTETNSAGAEAIAERLRRSVESHVFGADKERDIRVTISIGIAGCPEHGFSVDELIRKADAAMYEAKNLMKNKVRVAG